MVVYMIEQRWVVGLRSTYRRSRFWQKNHLLRWSWFWFWQVCKQAKLSHLGHRKPLRIHWKVKALKTSHRLVCILVQRHNWTIFKFKFIYFSNCLAWSYSHVAGNSSQYFTRFNSNSLVLGPRSNDFFK